MKRYLALLIVMLTAFSLTGCIPAGKSGKTSGRADLEASDIEEEVYLLYPQLMLLSRKLDEAEAYYSLGDLEYSQSLSRALIVDIDEFRSTDPDPFVCDHLDMLEHRALVLNNRIDNEESENEWRDHMTSVIDSIGQNHVVEEEIDVVINWRTEHWLRYFQGKGRRHFTRWLERVEMYRDIIEPILVEQELPRDLMYLAVIESGLNLDARSSVNATGPWQFMAGTGRLFGLRINWWIDERKDIVAATYAASNYLKYLYTLFGKWDLALAGYNAGEYRVAGAISRQKTDDYWRLRLPSQTKWFVPKYMAALTIGRDPAAYGFKIKPVEAVTFDMVRIDRSTDLKHISRGADCTVTRLKKLNPALKRWATPPGMEIDIKVPEGKGDAVLAVLAEIPPGERISWHRHKVKRGETLSRIASKYEISQSELKRINSVRNAHKIREGQILLIPVKDSGQVASASSKPRYKDAPNLPSKINVKKYTPPRGHTKVVHTVRDGDTLSEIAERYHVGLSKVRRWNNLRYSSTIHPGQSLVIYLPPGSEERVAESGGREYDPGRMDGKKRVYHTVRKGETLSSIGRLYRARVSDILVWNNIMKKDLLYPGDRLMIWVESD
jgi:membrane-bound lytic murein transglycosylase D